MKFLLSTFCFLLLSASVFALNVTLAWDANPVTDQVTTYQLYTATNISGPWSQIAIIAGSQTNWVLQVDNSQQRFYFLTASNLLGESLPSNTVSTPTGPNKVNNPKLTK